MQEHATSITILAGAIAARRYVGKGPLISHPFLVLFKLGGPSESAASWSLPEDIMLSSHGEMQIHDLEANI